MPELTQKIVDATRAKAGERLELRDAKVRGLVLRVSAASRSWSFEFRSPITRKMTRTTLPAITLADARAQAVKQKMAVTDKRDPALEGKEALQAKQLEHARAKSVATALDAYEADFVTGAKTTSRRERIAKLRRAVAPFNARPVASLAKGELVARLDVIQSESGPIARNRAQAEIRAWLGWLHEREHVADVALDGVKKRVDEKARERTRVLTDAELGAMFAATMDGDAFSDVVRVLLHTGFRKTEAASLQPRDLDFDARTITIRPEVSKTNRERVIPMAAAIASMLEERAEGLPADGYIFGDGSNHASPLSGWGKPTDRLRAAMGAEDWTLHDIRRTVATRLHDAGVDPLVIEDLLGHLGGVRGGMAGVYNRSVTLAKQREALNDWAAKLATLAGPNIVSLRRIG